GPRPGRVRLGPAQDVDREDPEVPVARARVGRPRRPHSGVITSPRVAGRQQAPGSQRFGEPFGEVQTGEGGGVDPAGIVGGVAGAQPAAAHLAQVVVDVVPAADDRAGESAGDHIEAGFLTEFPDYGLMIRFTAFDASARYGPKSASRVVPAPYQEKPS